MLYMGYYGLGYYLDPTYLLVIIGTLLCLGASALVNSTMNRYSGLRNASGYSGAEAARRILNSEGLYDVKVECLAQDKGDHYDPRTRTVKLSRQNYMSASVTSVSVAAHECGHALQHAGGYFPLKLRSSMVPVVNIGSNLGMPLILLGVILGWNQTLIQIGIWGFSLAVLFQLVTLPVEFNASSRALRMLQDNGILGSEEIRGTRKVLSAAALTYVASLAASVLQLLRLILLAGGRRRND